MTCTIHVVYMRHQYCVVGYLLLDGERTTMNKVSNQFHPTRQFIGLSLLPDSTNVANLKTPELSSTNYKHHNLSQRISWHDKLFTRLFFDRSEIFQKIRNQCHNGGTRSVGDWNNFLLVRQIMLIVLFTTISTTYWQTIDCVVKRRQNC